MDVQIILLFVVTYILCMFNPAIEICKKKTGQDIRRLGSMNAGTANTMRVLGKPLGILTMILEFCKVYIAYFIVSKLATFLGEDINTSLFQSMFILGVIMGHCFPAMYRFNGGKGITEAIALMLIFDPKYILICAVIGGIVILVTRIVSVGALIGCILYFIISIVMGCNYMVALCITLVIIIYRHRANIQRIFARQEKTF